jgi:hypothetical protein
MATLPLVTASLILGHLDEIREAMDRLDLSRQLQPSAFTRRHLNEQLRSQTWTGDHEQ